MNGYSAREVAGLLVTSLGLAVIASALLMNPWVPRIWQGALIVDRLDVLSIYFGWSLAIGFTIVALGLALPTAPNVLLGMTLMFLVGSGFILADRLLLVSFGLPMWEFDADLHYRHRPGLVRTLPGRTNALVRINQHGHHDSDFPEAKPAGEFRALMVGDSVTMGYGLTYAETFTRHLEMLLTEHDSHFESHQVINAGVHGYSTYQERRVLERSLRFAPDFIAMGFCMNDVTEPFLIDERHGGVGLDYHGVTQAGSNIWGYLTNETGVGRLLQNIRLKNERLEVAKRRELFNVKKMARLPADDPKYAEPWEVVLTNLEKMYTIADSSEIPIVLMIFPFEFQLLDAELRTPQRILSEHARRHGVDVIDYTDVFRRVIYQDRDLLEILRDRGYGSSEIRRFFRWKVAEYFLDSDHFTAAGNQVVAQELLAYLVERGIVGDEAAGSGP